MKAMRESKAFSDHAREYMESIQQVYPYHTIRTYRHVLSMLERDVEAMGLTPDLTAWDEAEVLEIRDLYVERYSPKSLSTRFAVLNNLLLHFDNGVIPAMRSKRRLRLPEPVRGMVRWLEDDTAMSLVISASGATRAALVLGLGLGLRRIEMARLRLKDMTRGQALVHGKGASNRVLPLRGWVMEELTVYIEGERESEISRSRKGAMVPDNLLLTCRGRRLRAYGHEAIYSLVQRHGRRQGMEVGLHDLRRTFGRALHRRGVEIQRIAYLLGHKDIKTTMDYLGLDLLDKEEALDTLYRTFRPEVRHL